MSHMKRNTSIDAQTDNSADDVPESSQDSPQDTEPASKPPTEASSRPRTRSQTLGKAPVRRVHSLPAVSPVKRTAPKRGRDTDAVRQTHKRTRGESIIEDYSSDDPPAQHGQRRASSPPSASPIMGDRERPTLPSIYTFLETTALIEHDRRGPRARAAAPVPVPNLTKKSRGRRVPTQTPTAEATPAPPLPPGTSRVYVCKVENCGKCFNRGEHLKRHIRSIHTYEKPFQCSYAGCSKYFNRHDNLLQHLKVHKDQALGVGTADLPPASEHDRLPPTTSSNFQFDQQHSFPSFNFGPPSQFSYADHSPVMGGSFTANMTNMTISSLRTPLSPPESPVSPMRMRYTQIQASFERGRPPSPGPATLPPLTRAPVV